MNQRENLVDSVLWEWVEQYCRQIALNLSLLADQMWTRVTCCFISACAVLLWIWPFSLQLSFSITQVGKKNQTQWDLENSPGRHSIWLVYPSHKFFSVFFFFFYAICCVQGNTPSSYPMSWSQDLLEFLILAYTFLWNLWKGYPTYLQLLSCVIHWLSKRPFTTAEGIVCLCAGCRISHGQNILAMTH